MVKIPPLKRDIKIIFFRWPIFTFQSNYAAKVSKTTCPLIDHESHEYKNISRKLTGNGIHRRCKSVTMCSTKYTQMKALEELGWHISVEFRG